MGTVALYWMECHKNVMISYLQLPGCFHPPKNADRPDGGDDENEDGQGGGEGEKEREGGDNNCDNAENPFDLYSTLVSYKVHSQNCFT